MPDVARLGIRRFELEYPTVNVSFSYLSIINRVHIVSASVYGFAVVTSDSFADRSVMAGVQVNAYSQLVGRLTNNVNFYLSFYNPGASAADHQLQKIVAGTTTTLATEAIDIDNRGRGLRLSARSTTISSMRYEITTPVDPLNPPSPARTISATDTSHTSGRWGYRMLRESSPHGGTESAAAYLLPAATPQPQPVLYLEVPVVGSGTPEDPFRPEMPEEVSWEWSLDPRCRRRYETLKSRGFSDDEIADLFPDVLVCRTNRLSVTYSALIASDPSTGRPREYVAVVRLYDQPDRQGHLRPLDRCVDEVLKIKGVRKLEREDAIRRALMLDDRLVREDLVPVSRSDKRFKTVVSDYVAHRRSLGVREEHIDLESIERFLTEYKGW